MGIDVDWLVDIDVDVHVDVVVDVDDSARIPVFHLGRGQAGGIRQPTGGATDNLDKRVKFIHVVLRPEGRP